MDCTLQVIKYNSNEIVESIEFTLFECNHEQMTNNHDINVEIIKPNCSPIKKIFTASEDIAHEIYYNLSALVGRQRKRRSEIRVGDIANYLKMFKAGNSNHQDIYDEIFFNQDNLYTKINPFDIALHKISRNNNKITENTLYLNKILKELSLSSFLCEQCGMTFSKKYSLQSHMNFHTSKGIDIKPTKENNACICPSCHLVRGNKYVFKHHIINSTCAKDFENGNFEEIWLNANKSKIKHMFQCEFCENAYENISAVIDHQSSHTSESYMCNICEVVLDSRDELEQHLSDCDYLRNYHFKITKYFICCVCSKGFLNYARLIKHRKTTNHPALFKKTIKVVDEFKQHNGEKSTHYFCEVCGLVVHSKRLWDIHQRLHK